MEDDEVVVIIVGDENEDEHSSYFPPIEIKQEILDETDGTLTTQAPAGEPVFVKEEILDEDEYANESDPDFVPEEIKEEIEDDKDYVPSDSEDEKKRYKLLRPSQRRSFVQELREQYPELENDEDLLVNSLVEVMRSVKPPSMPDHYIVNGIMLECVVCGGLTESIPAAGRHYQEKHGPRYLICFACGVDFRSTTNLYKHEKRCNGPDADIVLQARAIAVGNKGRHRPFLQAKNYRPRNSLTGLVPTKKGYSCNICSAVFYSKPALVSHLYLHNGLRPFRCTECPSAYTSGSALARHRKKHSGVKYICDHCSRPFNVKTALVSHMDTHLREMYFANIKVDIRPSGECLVYKLKRFEGGSDGEPTTNNIHVRDAYRKHACEECGRRFAQKSALILHIDGKHRNLPPPCACQLCPKRFRRMTLLKAHMKKVHGMLLMTRKMFFKKLPTMTDTQLQQAKVILKSEEPQYEVKPPEPKDINEEFMSFVNKNYVFDQNESEVKQDSQVKHSKIKSEKSETMNSEDLVN